MNETNKQQMNEANKCHSCKYRPAEGTKKNGTPYKSCKRCRDYANSAKVLRSFAKAGILKMKPRRLTCYRCKTRPPSGEKTNGTPYMSCERCREYDSKDARLARAAAALETATHQVDTDYLDWWKEAENARREAVCFSFSPFHLPPTYPRLEV
jgi:hypothetical protein